MQNKSIHKKVGIVVQARVGSRRLPTKVLTQIAGKPMLGWLIHRLKMVSMDNLLICAIPDSNENNVLESISRKYGAHVIRGPEEDVLSRYMMAADQFNLSDVVRITADCPLIDFRIIDTMSKIHFEGDWDFTANLVGTEKSFPRGMDVEIVKTSCLHFIAEIAHEQKYREHVTLYVYENHANLRTNIIAPPAGHARSDLRLCVDEQADLELVKKIYKHFLPKTDFSLNDIIAFLDENQGIAKLNKNVEQKSY